MTVDRAARDLRLPGEITHGHGAISLLDEEGIRRLDQRGTSRAGLLGQRRGHAVARDPLAIRRIVTTPPVGIVDPRRAACQITWGSGSTERPCRTRTLERA